MTTENKILELPILPLRNTVIFPSGITPLTVGRPLSLAAAEAALRRLPSDLRFIRRLLFSQSTQLSPYTRSFGYAWALEVILPPA